MWHLQTTLRLSRRFTPPGENERFYPRGAEARPAVLVCALLTLAATPTLHLLGAGAGCAILKSQKNYLWCNISACLPINFPEEPQ